VATTQDCEKTVWAARRTAARGLFACKPAYGRPTMGDVPLLDRRCRAPRPACAQPVADTTSDFVTLLLAMRDVAAKRRIMQHIAGGRADAKAGGLSRRKLGRGFMQANRNAASPAATPSARQRFRGFSL